MDRIVSKTNPQLFDAEALRIQEALSEGLPWLDHAIGICETLTDIKEGRKFVSANFYKGNGRYEQIMPCDELGNFSFFVLKDPQEIVDNYLVKSPVSLILWYDMREVSLPLDERNTEAVKAQILGVLNGMHSSAFQIGRIYEKAQNVFAEYSYIHTDNQHLMSPYAGIRIDGTLIAKIPCHERVVETFYLRHFGGGLFLTSDNNRIQIRH